MTETIENPVDINLSNNQNERWMVIAYNNEVNTYEEVMSILILATHCNEEEAYIETWEIDHYGSTVVHIDSKESCEKVASIISGIGVETKVVSDSE